MLDVNDVDLINKTMIVTEKGEKVRTYDIPDTLCEAIKDWLEYRDEIVQNNETDALFISRLKRRMNEVTVYNVVKRYAEDVIDDKNITPHKLRATYGTQLYNKTGDIYFVQECMGHSNPKVTELYVRDKKQNTKRASDIMEKLL
jgi:site-specific recombinase XerD